MLVRGMDCADESSAIRRSLAEVPGVEEVSFDLLAGTLTASHDDERVSEADLVRAVAAAGFSARVLGQSDSPKGLEEPRPRATFRNVMTAASGSMAALGFGIHFATEGYSAASIHGSAVIPTAARLAYLVGIASGLVIVFPKALSALRHLRADMNLLMTFAVAGAVAIGELLEAATVTFLFAASLALESWGVSRARRAIASLLDLAPPAARVVGPAGREEMTDVAAVPVGATVVVKPGERIPLDGTVTKGRTSVDQSPLTGESMPISRDPGDEVFAGSINQAGAIEVRTNRVSSESTLSRVVGLVAKAREKRALSERWVDAFANYYTPSVLALALAVAVVSPLLFAASWSSSLYDALVLLVIACPCALVISTPVTIVSALASAARNGVLVKGGEFVELPARIRLFALDKTGTITHGRPEVARIVAFGSRSEPEVAGLAASVELRSEHPLARAVVRHAAERGLPTFDVDDVQALPGRGVTARLGEREVWVGSRRLLAERGVDATGFESRLDGLAELGATVVFAGEEREAWGAIAIADRIRPAASRALADLRAEGIERIVMLTGDNERAARAVSEASGVDECRADLLPEDKIRVVEELVRRYGTVAMVGDGVNDAPALARATLGIAMGAIGSAAAIETADIALMTDDLSRLPWLVRLSKRTRRIVRQNVSASLGVKATFVALAFTGYGSLWAAIAADMGISLLVVFNALRLVARGRDDRSP